MFMKTMVLISAVVFFLALGLKCFYRAGNAASRQVIAEISDGADRLTLTAFYHSSTGNSYAARLLYFNEKLVDFLGSFPERPLEGGKIFPLNPTGLRIDVLQEEKAEAMLQRERLHRNISAMTGTVPYDLLNQDSPDLEDGTPWTVWVNPKAFTVTEYERIINLLRQYADELYRQQLIFETNGSNNPNTWLRFPGLIIWRAVYHDYQSLEIIVFRRNNGATREEVIITPYGMAEYRQKSQRYPFGFGCSLGALNETADTLFIGELWAAADVTFPASELKQFKDEQGRALTQVYNVVDEQ
jgi:hypothetical protein